MMKKIVTHKLREVSPDRIESTKRNSENDGEKEKTKQKRHQAHFKNTVNKGKHIQNITKTGSAHKYRAAKKRKNEKTEKRAAGQRERKNTRTSKVVPQNLIQTTRGTKARTVAPVPGEIAKTQAGFKFFPARSRHFSLRSSQTFCFED